MDLVNSDGFEPRTSILESLGEILKERIGFQINGYERSKWHYIGDYRIST